MTEARVSGEASAPGSGPPIRISRLADFGALQLQRGAWNALLRRCPSHSIFQTLEWHLSWLRAFGDGAEPLVLLAEAGGELVGVAPLLIRERRLLGRRTRVVEFIGAGASDYCDFLVDRDRPDALARLLESILRHREDWDVLELWDLPEGSPLLEAAPPLLARRELHVDLRPLYGAYAWVFGDRREDARLVAKKSLRRHDDYFKRNGVLEFRNLRSCEAIVPHLATFFAQHVERWRATDTPSQFLDERQRLFYRALTESLSARHWLLFSVLLFDEQPIAFHFGFEYENRIFWYKPSFDLKHAKHSPGEVLLKRLLEYSIGRELAEFDFTIGDEAYKRRFANRTGSSHALCVFRRRTDYRASRLWWDGKALAERSPGIARLGRRLVRRGRNRWRGGHPPWAPGAPGAPGEASGPMDPGCGGSGVDRGSPGAG